MARYTHDVIVLGGGSGGLTATVGCAQLGTKTALVEKELLGGDCLHDGCVPSKTLIRSATVYQQAKEAARFGLPALEPPPVDMSAINARIASVIETIQEHDSPERFQKLGAEVLFGHAEFTSPHEIRLNDDQTITLQRHRSRRPAVPLPVPRHRRRRVSVKEAPCPTMRSP